MAEWRTLHSSAPSAESAPQRAGELASQPFSPRAARTENKAASLRQDPVSLTADFGHSQLLSIVYYRLWSFFISCDRLQHQWTGGSKFV